MKRRDILRIVMNAGFELEEGGRHTKVLENGKLITEIPRHNEIGEILAKKILDIKVAGCGSTTRKD